MHKFLCTCNSVCMHVTYMIVTAHAICERLEETFSQSRKQDSFSHICTVQLVCMKVHVYSSLEPPLEYNQEQIPLTNPD